MNRVVRVVRVVRGVRGFWLPELLRWSVAQGEMGTPTSWLFGDAPDGRLLGTLTFGQLFGVRLRVRLWELSRVSRRR